MRIFSCIPIALATTGVLAFPAGHKEHEVARQEAEPSTFPVPDASVGRSNATLGTPIADPTASSPYAESASPTATAEAGGIRYGSDGPEHEGRNGDVPNVPLVLSYQYVY